jgi:hypothetical protein
MHQELHFFLGFEALEAVIMKILSKNIVCWK